MGRETVARQAAAAALRVRARLKRALELPVCPYQVAEDLGVKVRFEPLASLEGLYAPDEPLIVIGSLRPRGRRNFTCGHELGHHVLGHGFRLDEALAGTSPSVRDDAEFSADRFSTALLMPKIAIERAFALRGWQITACSPRQVYVIANFFGVGYSTLVGYLEHTLGVITSGFAATLRTRPSAIRKEILSFEPPHDLVVVDDYWGDRDVDVDVGDLVLVPPDADVSGDAVHVDRVSGQILVRADRPGIAAVRHVGGTSALRVARREFRGLSAYRHLEDPEYEP